MANMNAFIGVLLVAMLATGCKTLETSVLLPSEEEETTVEFSSHKEALDAFQMIYMGTTRSSELPSIGFDPADSNNVTILQYTDIVSMFLSNPTLTLEDIPKGIRDCLAAQGGCIAYKFNMEHIDKKRYGNFFVDVMNFRKRTHTTGWKFEATIIIVDDIVVYALHNGQPKIDTKHTKRNPLGPLQGIDGDSLRELAL